MLASLNSTTLLGVTALPVKVEIDISNGLPRYSMVGLPDAGASESYERVWGALRNSKYQHPQNRVTVNLAPGDIRKEGPHFDLAIALGIIAASGSTPLTIKHLENIMVMGELAMSGDVRPVRGVLPSLITAKKMKITTVIIPYANYQETSIVHDLTIVPVHHLQEAVEYLLDPEKFAYPSYPEVLANEESNISSSCHDSLDLELVCGQYQARRALEICAAGRHHLLLQGPPGAGKTLLARCLPTILPPLSPEQSLEVTAIHSTVQNISTFSLTKSPPFRAPGTNITLAGLVGSTNPGEISLAHHGVLFMDEFPEYRRECLEALRTPLERGHIEIARSKFHTTYPCKFTLVAAMNPCHCGYFGDKERECLCTPSQRDRYYHRISEPILDRIALQVRVERPRPEDLISTHPRESSHQVFQRVKRARAIQAERGFYNEEMTPAQIKKYCVFDAESNDFLQKATKNLALSARVFSSIVRVARTIADLKELNAITLSEISEALDYRGSDRNALPV